MTDKEIAALVAERDALLAAGVSMEARDAALRDRLARERDHRETWLRAQIVCKNAELRGLEAELRVITVARGEGGQ